MEKPAARMSDITSHGGMIVTGSTNVFFNGIPAANAMSTHVCPMVTPGTPPVPHIGMTAIPKGALTVLINGVPAIVKDDMFLCVGPPAKVVLGSPNIIIGNGGSDGGNCGVDQAAMESGLMTGKILPIKGTEAYPIDIQITALLMQKYHTPEQFELDLKQLDSMAKQRVQERKEDTEPAKLTLKDFVEIFESIEREQGYEAARHYASVGINYGRLTAIAKQFTDGQNTNPDNDPNIMPTRFMLLYGAEDDGLRIIDKHPDCFGNSFEHKINISNLRKGLRLLGAKIAETGRYDDELWKAHAQYINNLAGSCAKIAKTHTVQESETLGAIARMYGLPTWKYLYNCNRKRIGENPDLLEKGIVIDIPQWDSTSGDEKIAAKGADPAYYAHGSRYRYPWVPFSTSVVNEKNVIAKNNGRKEEFQYQLLDHGSGNVLASGKISNGDELEVLIPDSQEIGITIDDYTCNIK